MRTQIERKEEGQSLVLVTIAIVVIFVFVVLAVDIGNAYVHRRTDQNAADAAALAGARELAGILNDNNGKIPAGASENSILSAMNSFAEQNGIEDTDERDHVNDNVVGYYLAADGSRLGGENAQGEFVAIVIGARREIHPDARGVEVVVNSLAPSFFGGVLGLTGLTINAEAAVLLNQGVCSAGCLAPIATLWEDFQYGQCYEIWDGAKITGGNTTPSGQVCSNDETVECDSAEDCNFGTCKQNGKCSNKSSRSCSSDADCGVGTCGEPGTTTQIHTGGNFGWLNWSWNGHPCQDVDPPDEWPQQSLPNDCSTPCLEYHLWQGGLCDSGMVDVGSWVAGVPGVKNAHDVRHELDWYIDNLESFTIIIYDVFGEPWGKGGECGHVAGAGPKGFGYHVVGFARFQPVGYDLSSGANKGAGEGNSGNMRLPLTTWNGKPLNCPEWNSQKGNQIAGVFIEWVTADALAGDCDDYGVSAPQMTK